MSSNPGIPCEQVFQLGVLISCLASPHLAPMSLDEPMHVRVQDRGCHQ